jgi:uncharacterized integral membrane protein
MAGMLRWLRRLAYLIVGVAVIWITWVNVTPVELRFFLGYQLRAPLIVLVFGAFAAGALLAMLVAAVTIVRQRRQIERLLGGRSGRASVEPTPPLDGI